MQAAELAELVAALRRIGRDDAGLEVKLASTDKLPNETAQTLCAFANTPGGGTLILGLDEGRGFATTGCEYAAKLSADIAGLCRDALHPPLVPLISLPQFEGQDPCRHRGAGARRSRQALLPAEQGAAKRFIYPHLGWRSSALVVRGEPIIDQPGPADV